MQLSKRPVDLPPGEYALFKELFPCCSVLVDLETGKLLEWDHVAMARVRIPCADGSYLVVCWWVLKAMLLPERPDEATLQTLPAEQQRGPWRQHLVLAEPKHHVPDQPVSLGGTSYSMDGNTDGPMYERRRETNAWKAYLEAGSTAEE